MKPVFSDTSFYVALLGKHDVSHQRAVEISENLLGRIVTTEYVLVETAGMLSKGQDRAACATLFHESGYNVVLMSRTKSELSKTAMDIAGPKGSDRLLTLVGDVSEEVFVQKLFAESCQRFGVVDTLINNVGGYRLKSYKFKFL